MANKSISLVLLALNQYGGDVFRMTLVSSGSYEAALQEVLGMGRVMLKNDHAVVRVEIYKDAVTPDAPLVVLTQDDISLEEQILEKRQKKNFHILSYFPSLQFLLSKNCKEGKYDKI